MKSQLGRLEMASAKDAKGNLECPKKAQSINSKGKEPKVKKLPRKTWGQTRTSKWRASKRGKRLKNAQKRRKISILGFEKSRQCIFQSPEIGESTKVRGMNESKKTPKQEVVTRAEF